MDAERRVMKASLSMYPATWTEVDEFAHTQHLTRSAAAEVLVRIAFGLLPE